MKKITLFKSLLLAAVLVVGSGSVWAADITLNFEGTGTFPFNSDWTITNGSKNTEYKNSGENSCVSNQNATSFIIAYKNKVIGTLTQVKYYASKTSTNTTSTQMFVETSTDGKTWTKQHTFNISGTTKGVFTEVIADLSSKNLSDVYVRLSKSSNTAQRLIDDITITYKPAAPDYTITATSNNTELGTVSIDGAILTAIPGQCVEYADPAYTVITGEATVKQDGDIFTVTPTSECTVQINFATIPSKTVTLDAGNGNIEGESSLTQENCESPIMLPEATACVEATGWTFAGWSEILIDETTEEPELLSAGEYIPTNNVTLYAVYQKGEKGTAAYKLLTSAPTNWDGDYLIAAMDENNEHFFNGSLSELDATNNFITFDGKEVDGSISTDWGNNYKFTIEDGNAIKSVSGHYIYNTKDDNDLITSTNKPTNTLSFNWIAENEIEIECKGSVLRYNASSGQDRFRFFKSTSYKNQKKIYMYKLEGEPDNRTFATAPSCSSGPGTGLTPVEISSLYAADGAIHFNATAGERVTMHNVMGQTIYSGITTEGLNSIAVPAGIVMVKVGDTVNKVIVK